MNMYMYVQRSTCTSIYNIIYVFNEKNDDEYSSKLALLAYMHACTIVHTIALHINYYFRINTVQLLLKFPRLY